MNTPRTTLNLNLDWRFHRGEAPGSWMRRYDDSAWRSVTVPHDWSVEEPFDVSNSSGTGYLPGGVGVYRKIFTLPGEGQGSRVRLTFEGVYNNAQVWLNGYYLGKRPYGYSTFSYDVTDFAAFGDATNLLVVQVNHHHVADSRWFTGSGIYRDVWVTLTSPLAIAEYGVFATTPEVTAERARIEVRTDLDNHGSEVVAEVVHALEGPEGTVATCRLPVTAGAGATTLTGTLEVSSPRLWSPESPALYTLRTELRSGGAVVDAVETRVGLRTFLFNADTGFSLNGVPTKFKGVCVHHDAGCLGAAVPASVWRQRLLTLKDQGCNAIRTAHNPPAPALLDLCDELGFLVMDEAFDEWEGVKNKWSTGHNVYPPQHYGYFEDFPEWGERDLKAMVLRDRNHPSVVLWSIGNEIDYPNDPYGHPLFQQVTGNNDANKPEAERFYDPGKPNAERLVPIAKKLVAWVKECDPTRPVTAALALPELSNLTGLASTLDVVGYNYKEHLYVEDHAKYPGQVVYGSENAGSLEAWQAVDSLEHNAGLFVWTGIDYLGEARGWPVRVAQSGFLDLAGTPKPRYHFFRSLWSDAPTAYLSVRDAEVAQKPEGRWVLGEPQWVAGTARREVLAFTNAPRGELKLNGRSLGVQDLDPAKRCLSWMVDFDPGILELTALFGEGKRTCALRTPGPAAVVKVTAPATLRADGQDIATLEIALEDAEGLPVYAFDQPLTVRVSGPAQLRGLENGDPADLTPYSAASRRVVHGRLVAYVRSTTAGGPGERTVTVTVSGPGLRTAEVVLTVQS